MNKQQRPEPPNTCVVFVENGFHFVAMPNGERIPGIVNTIVGQGLNGRTELTLEIHCRLIDSKDISKNIKDFDGSKNNEIMKLNGRIHELGNIIDELAKPVYLDSFINWLKRLFKL
jgi:hypothetical protein